MTNNISLDGKEIIVRIIKYLLEGAVVGVAAVLIPKKKISMEEVLTIALISSSVFSLLDLFAPSISNGARSGTGLAIGGGIVGGFPTR